ncbi:replication protein [Escherichia coli]|nr:replication protein [Escherichia coli]
MSNTAKIYDFSAAHERRSNRMENQKTGYIPLYRSILKQSWAKDVYLRTLWENLLLNAARKPYKANFKGHEWHLQPGQLVVTAADLGLQLCDRHGKPASRDQVERMLQVFVKEGMITIDGEKQKGRVITITNYHEYAQKMDNSPAHEAAQTTAHDAAHDEASNGAAFSVHSAHESAHEAAQTTAHHEQEGINKNINNRVELINRIGQEAVDEIESNHNRHRWTVEECRAIKAEYQQKLKKLRNSRSEAA